MSDKRWRLVAGFDPVSYVCGDEVVLYDRFSGDTHLLDGLSLRLLDFLAQNSELGETQLATLLAAELGLDADDQELRAFVETRLRALVQLNILQAAKA